MQIDCGFFLDKSNKLYYFFKYEASWENLKNNTKFLKELSGHLFLPQMNLLPDYPNK